MKPRQIAVILLVALASLPVRADYDAKLEAEEAAKRRAAQQEQARRKAEADRMLRDAEQKAMRQALGPAAQGKSDAEVRVLYDAKMKRDREEGAKRAAEGQKMLGEAQRASAASRPQTDAAMKGMYGKSLTDLEKMSDKELEAFARDMEKKYGGAK